MNKNAIQRFAVWARTELIAQVSQRAFQYGITKDGYGEANAVALDGRVLSGDEQNQRRELVEQIRAKGYAQVMEEVAYTWFNRFIALRFMEVNNYLPSHIRVFSDGTGAFKPEILGDVLHLELPGLDKAKVAELIEANDYEALYRYLLLTQCNALNEALPRMFEKMGGFTELLLPNNILKPDSVPGRMVSDIPEEDWTDQVQIIGWLYQYYISEKHEDVIDPLHGKVIAKEDVPAATQLFTTDWVVRYMVDNSLGRYWIERHPESKLADKLAFFASPKEGIAYINEAAKPENMTFFDPCVGSGHILVYAFDVLMEMYKESGYTEREAAALIIQNNLFGLDIDSRAAQLAYFSVMMMGCKYDRRFLKRQIQPNIYQPGNYADGEEYGSLLLVDKLEPKPEETRELSLFGANYEDELNKWNFRRLLSQKYTVVVTNPPYLNRYSPKLKDFINKYYKDYSGDMFSAFMYRNLLLCKPDGYCGYMTPFVWMFIKTYEKLRRFIISNNNITTLVQMEYSAFEEATVPICSFVLKCGKGAAKGIYFKLTNFKGGMEVQKQKVLEAIANKDCGYFYESDQSNFSKIPGSPVAYWVSERIFNSFCHSKVNAIAFSDGQILTGNNETYLRMLWEVEANEIRKNGKWMLHAKGGEYRKWAGNLEWVVKWSPSAIEHYKHDKIARFPKNHVLFRKGVTWSLVSTNPTFGARLLPESQTFNKAAATVLFHDEKYVLYVLALLNSSVVNYLSKIINPTLNNNIKDILAMPFIYNAEKAPQILEFVDANIKSSQNDWDSDETSWDFKRNPLM